MVKVSQKQQLTWLGTSVNEVAMVNFISRKAWSLLQPHGSRLVLLIPNDTR